MAKAGSRNEDITHEWRILTSSPKFNLFDQAFREAKLAFTQSPQGTKNVEILDSTNSLQEIQDTLASALAKYESQKANQKGRKWLQSFSQRVALYGDILDVLVQHHPEYVSLVWGAMKFLFTAVINHERTTTKLAKALSQIADTLPRVKLVSFLYPTERMKAAVVELIAHILRFLTRAHKWYQEGTLKHVIHSLTQPVELRYDDILESISECSEVVHLVADCSQQLEMREMHGKINEISLAVNAQWGQVERRLQQINTEMSLQSTAMVDTNYRLSDLQFSQIMQSISDDSMWEPTKVLEFILATCRRQSRGNIPQLSDRFLTSPKLKRWTSSAESEISIMKGNFRSRQSLRAFCGDVIQQLQCSSIPVLFALKTPFEESAPSNTTPIDILKYLVRQGLQQQQSFQTEKAMSLRCASFYNNRTETQWFQLLESILSEFNRLVYIIVDLELLGSDFHDGYSFDWLTAFRNFFSRLSENRSGVQVKVLLASYSSDFPFLLTDVEFNNFVITAKVKSLTQRHKKQSRKGPRGQRVRI